MPSLRLLNGLAHDIGQHAQSATSWLHPHLGEACRSRSFNGVQLNLLEGAAYPDGLPVSEPLGKAIESFRQRFAAMVEAKGLTLSDLKVATITFRFVGGASDYDCAVRTTVVSREGEAYSHDLGFMQ